MIAFLASNDKILRKVRFVEDIHDLSKAIFNATMCINVTPFNFYKNNQITPDVETAFLDIRYNPEEKNFIGLFFKDRENSPEYAAVLEVNPMEKQNIVKDNLLELVAELVLDEAVYKFNKKKLYEEIDLALLNGDKERFIELTNRLNLLLKTEKK